MIPFSSCVGLSLMLVCIWLMWVSSHNLQTVKSYSARNSHQNLLV
jgi:hypothetical protein